MPIGTLWIKHLFRNALLMAVMLLGLTACGGGGSGSSGGTSSGSNSYTLPSSVSTTGQ